MESILLELVNKKILIRTKQASVKRFCCGYETVGEPELSITVNEEGIRRERKANSGTYKWRLTLDELEFCAIQRQIVSCLSDQGILLFHGSAICVDGRTYVFTAPSGTLANPPN